MSAGTIVVLMYHALYRDERDLGAIEPDDRPFAVHVDAFRSQIMALRDGGVSLLPATALAGRNGAPGVVLTFDDGHASNYSLAFPLLARLQVPALMFLTTGFIGQRKNFLDWRAVREMQRDRICFGSHGHTHRFLDALGEAELRAELSTSHRALSDELGHPPDSLSFPGGCYGSTTVRIAAGIGFAHLYTSGLRAVRSGGGAPATIPRVAVRRSMPLERFVALATDARGALARARMAEHVKRGVRRLIGHDAYMYLYARVPR